MSMSRGKFIVFGGLDETGKTTQSQKLVATLKKMGIPVFWTKEPGGTTLGDALKPILTSNQLSPKTQLLLFQAAREEHLEKVIRPAIASGTWVVTDRFFESSYIYQGAMGVNECLLLESHQLFGQHDPMPDLTFLLKGKAGNRPKENALDHFCEKNRQELEERVKSFQWLFHSNKSPHFILDVTEKGEEEVFQQIWHEVRKRM